MQLMRSMWFSLTLLATPITAGTADVVFPAVGGFGFDWLAPDSAQCKRISTADAKVFAGCIFHKSGAFGLPYAYHTCAFAGAEMLIFKSEDECQEALETMQANAP